MKVNTENTGNYSLQTVNQKRESPQHERKIKESKPEKKFGLPSEEYLKTDKNISEEEKTFFANLYPLNKNEIMDYHYYQKSGKPSGIALGSLFDKRG